MNRREIGQQRALMQATAQVRVTSASNATVVAAEIDKAVSGDLVAASPSLRAKLEELDRRISEIEPETQPEA